MVCNLQRTEWPKMVKNAIFDIFENIGKYEVIKRVVQHFHKNSLIFSSTY